MPSLCISPPLLVMVNVATPVIEQIAVTDTSGGTSVLVGVKVGSGVLVGGVVAVGVTVGRVMHVAVACRFTDGRCGVANCTRTIALPGSVKLMGKSPRPNELDCNGCPT